MPRGLLTARARKWCFAAICLALPFAPSLSAQSDYQKDVDFALESIARECGDLIAQKQIDWKAISKEFSAASKTVNSHAEHLVLLTRLLARLRDGHAEVLPSEATKSVRWPDAPELVGAGMFLCRSGKKILLKTVYGSAKELGLEAGSEVVKVDGQPVDAWLKRRVAELSETQSFSTDQHAFFRATHQGLALPKGTRLDLELKEPGGKTKKRTITYTRGNATPWGPAVAIEGLESTDDLNFKWLDDSVAYVHVRRCKETLPAQMDVALAKLHTAKAMILDFRANSGGGFDHAEFMGRFVPAGERLSFGNTYESRGEHPFAGPIVVIVDGTVVSAGETGSGSFKEDGRAYMIGESATAGMSSQKTTLALPSGLFSLYVSTRSNKQSFNGGRGLEGIGVLPHEIVPYEAKDLAAGVDTLIRRATELAGRFPADKVPYRAP